MRIVYLNPCGKWGGAETSLRELLACVRRSEPDWELWLLLGEDGPLADTARELGVRVVVKPFPPALGGLGDARGLGRLRPLVRATGATVAYARSLAGWLRQVQPDLIHTNGFKMHLLGAWARPSGTPLIWHIHDYVSSRPMMGRLLRLFGGACTLSIVNSKSVAADMRGLFPKLRVIPIYNAIDLQRFSSERAKLDLDDLAGLPPAVAGTLRVGLVATFARWKGHKVFLNALARLSREAPVRGYVIGGPIYQTGGSQWSFEELRQEADALGLTGRIGFTGFVDDNASAMRSLDVVVHASTEPEPFGMVIIEAMACSKAVIASRAGGATELFDEGVQALSHAPGDASALAEQIQRLVSEPKLRHELGQAAHASVQERFAGSRLSRELVAVYREVVDGSARGTPAMQSTVSAAGGDV
jgi:glycosyltransferase involved in cell wall biosynthesis